MAPVAADIAHAEQDGLVAGLGFGQGLRPPGPPLDGVVLMGKEKGAGGVVEAHRSVPIGLTEGCFPPARFYDVFGAGLLTSDAGHGKDGLIPANQAPPGDPRLKGRTSTT